MEENSKSLLEKAKEFEVSKTGRKFGEITKEDFELVMGFIDEQINLTQLAHAKDMSKTKYVDYIYRVLVQSIRAGWLKRSE